MPAIPQKDTLRLETIEARLDVHKRSDVNNDLIDKCTTLTTLAAAIKLPRTTSVPPPDSIRNLNT